MSTTSARKSLSNESQDIAFRTEMPSEQPQEKSSAEVIINRGELEEQKPSQPEFQEGGLRAWVTVVGAWFALFATFGYINAFGVYQDYYTRIFLDNVTPSAVSWIGSFQFFVPLVMGVWVGRLFDRGYFHHLMIFGSVIYIFSLFMLSLAKPKHYYQVFLSQAVGMGIGLGCIFTPAVSISSQYFRRKRALAAGLALSGSSVGAIIHPILLNNLFHKPHVGFAGGVRASAYMIAGCLVIANLMMRTKTNLKQAGVQRPQMLPWKFLLSDVSYVLTVAGAFLCLITVYFPTFYIQLYSITNGVSMTPAFYSVAILNAGSVVGRILPNLLADFVGPFNLVIPCVVACGGLMFSLLGIRDAASMAVVSTFYGIFSGAYLALVVAVVASLARSPAEIGQRIGIAFTATSIAALIGTPIAGALLTNDLHWIRAIIFSAVCVLLGAGFFTAARLVHIRERKM
jgi:MFS family permease